MPTLGVSLLKACIRQNGFSSKIRYFNMDLADRIGLDLYRKLANAFPPESMIGEWFFAHALFGQQLPDEEEYLAKILYRYPDGARLAPDILKARKIVGGFVDYCAAE